MLLDPTQRTVDLVTVEQADRAILSNLSLAQSLSVVWPQIVGLARLDRGPLRGRLHLVHAPGNQGLK